jgi:ribonuclease P protein component
MRAGYDYVLIGRRAALDLPFDRLIEDFARALGRVHGGTGAGMPTSTTPHAGTR